MGRRGHKESQQEKIERITRLTGTIAHIESYLQFFETQREQAQDCCWVSRYQVRQEMIKFIGITSYRLIDLYLSKKMLNL